jgi:dolichyl-phosphate-mannose--protein O-mannosyl transferase
VAQVVLIAILAAALFTRFWRLDVPSEFIFDEVYFPKTGQEILRGDPHAWDFYGHENTHPPLSKLFMAGGMLFFGENAWGWRFFGALAGVGAVVFMYLLAKKLFDSEVAGLAGASLLTLDGLAFAQSRIATPDTYVLFFVLGTVYFLVSDRFLLAGVFFGAGAACKWIAAFTMIPIVIYLVWRLIRGIAEREPDARLRPVEGVLLVGAVFAVAGVVLAAAGSLLAGGFSSGAEIGGIPFAIAAVIFLAGLIGILGSEDLRRTARGRLYLELAVIFPVFFLVVPGLTYLLTYLPMLANGHSLSDVWELNRAAYDFHSTLDATHPYQSVWLKWPIMERPVFFHVVGYGKIYALGNPIIFWLGIPALGFLALRGLNLRARINSATGGLAISATFRQAQWPLIFVALSFLGFWLPWATQPRIMFIYHYLPALSFVILALAYCVHWMWHHKLSRDALIGLNVAWIGAALGLVVYLALERDKSYYMSWGAVAIAALVVFQVGVREALSRVPSLSRFDNPSGQALALTFLVAVMVTFAYFYPHLAAIDVSPSFDETYYWFQSWR